MNFSQQLKDPTQVSLYSELMMFEQQRTLIEIERLLCKILPKDICENVCDHVYRRKFEETLLKISEMNWAVFMYNSSSRRVPGKRWVQYFLYEPIVYARETHVSLELQRQLFDILRVISNKNELRIQRNIHGVVVVTEW